MYTLDQLESRFKREFRDELTEKQNALAKVGDVTPAELHQAAQAVKRTAVNCGMSVQFVEFK